MPYVQPLLALRTLVLVAAAALALAACRTPPDTEAPAAPPDTVVAVPIDTTTRVAAPACLAAAVPTERPARPDTLTVLFFGDSLTEGYGLPGGKSEAYPARIAERIDEAGLPARVVNAGISGNTTADGRARIDWVLRQSRPDVFVLALGGNDGLRGLAAENMKTNLEAILCAVREANPFVRFIIAGMEAPPNYGGAYTTEFRAVYPVVAEEFDADLVPFLLDHVAGLRALNQSDRIHPTPEGQRIVAATVWRTLEPIIREEAER